jgi:hypothetical protein
MTCATKRGQAGAKRRIIQFDWSRHWKKKVAPHLSREAVKIALHAGMSLLDPDWQDGDAPYLLGAIPLRRTRVVPGKLSWYRPWARCHWIAFFSMTIGVLNYPDLDWRFLSGDCHTIPVGYGPDGEPRVVMDILLFDEMTAEESIANTQRKAFRSQEKRVKKSWDKMFKFFTQEFIPVVRERFLSGQAA